MNLKKKNILIKHTIKLKIVQISYCVFEDVVAFPTSATSTSSETEVANAIETTKATTMATSVASPASSTSSASSTEAEDESFFHSVVTKTVDGFVVSSRAGSKIIFPSKPTLQENQEKEAKEESTFVVPSWFAKLTQRYVEPRQKRTISFSSFWAPQDDEMGGHTNDISNIKYIYPNYESRNDLLLSKV